MVGSAGVVPFETLIKQEGMKEEYKCKKTFI
jgi:hypothetical protein